MSHTALSAGGFRIALEYDHVAGSGRLRLEECAIVINAPHAKDGAIELEGSLRLSHGQCDMCQAVRAYRFG